MNAQDEYTSIHTYIHAYIQTQKDTKDFADDNIINGEANSTTTHNTNGVVADGNVDDDGKSDVAGDFVSLKIVKGGLVWVSGAKRLCLLPTVAAGISATMTTKHNTLHFGFRAHSIQQHSNNNNNVTMITKAVVKGEIKSNKTKSRIVNKTINNDSDPQHPN